MRPPRVKKMTKQEGIRHNISQYPNFNKSGSITGMRKKFYGNNALLVSCGDYIYNVSDNPVVYECAN